MVKIVVPNKKGKVLNCRIEEGVLKDLKIIAKENHVSMSALVRVVLENYCKRNRPK